jgi:hypothetical protein
MGPSREHVLYESYRGRLVLATVAASRDGRADETSLRQLDNMNLHWGNFRPKA